MCGYLEDRVFSRQWEQLQKTFQVRAHSGSSLETHVSEGRKRQAGEPEILWGLQAMGTAGHGDLEHADLELSCELSILRGSSKGIEQENDVICLNLKFQDMERKERRKERAQQSTGYFVGKGCGIRNKCRSRKTSQAASSPDILCLPHSLIH